MLPRWRPGLAVREHRLRIPPPEKQLEKLLFRNYISARALFERSLYEKAGGFRGHRRSQDWDLWIRMLATGARVTSTDTPTVLYRLRLTRLPLDYILGIHIEVLEGFIRDHEDPHLVTVAMRAIRENRARIALARAFEAAATGDVREARRRARGGLSGALSVKIRSAIMMGAPRGGAVVKRRRATRTLQGEAYEHGTDDVVVHERQGSR